MPESIHTFVEIDLQRSTIENALAVIRSVVATSETPRSERKIHELALHLSHTVDQTYDEAWSLASVPLKRSGMGLEKIEDIRQAVLFGCWVEIVTTIGPGVQVTMKETTS